ncbi:MAG: hypothetical protein LH613_05460, partial [Chamaesiphon sp.]|nr:hypothetical protein [Chamaesiphon sp.]
MLNISKYHSAIVCCSVVATASLAGFAQSAHAAEQIVCPNVRADRGTVLIAQTNSSNTTGTNVSNTTGTNVSNTTGSSVPTSPSGSSSLGGGSSGGVSPAVIARASTLGSRLSTAQSNYSRAAGTLAQAETAQPTVAASAVPVRYGRQAVADIASCGCPNADTVGTNPTARPEL